MRTLCKRLFTTGSASAKPYSILYFGSDEFSKFTMNFLMGNSKYHEVIKRLVVVGTSVGRNNSAADYFHRTLKEKKIEKYTFRTNFKSLEKFIREQYGKDQFPFDLAVVASFPKPLPEDLINHFAKGVIVAHPALAPDYEGGSPIEHQIVNGEKKGGVSIVEATKGRIGIGRILLKKECPIETDNNYLDLAAKYGNLAGQALIDVLEDLDGFMQKAEEPKFSSITKKAPLMTMENSAFLWDRLTVEQAVRKQMALFGSSMPGWTKFRHKGKWFYIYFDYLRPENDKTSEYYDKILAPIEGKAQPGNLYWNRRGEHKKLFIRCVDGWVSTEGIKVDGERSKTAESFIANHLREHFEEKQKFVYKFACCEDFIKYEVKL